MQEQWKDIKGFGNYYQISNLGRVKSLARVVPGKKKKTLSSKILNTHTDPRDGYWRAFLRKDGKTTTIAIHRLVYEAFTGPIPQGHHIDHIDGNKSNNTPSNLRALSRSDHRKETVRRFQHAKGVRVGNAKLDEKKVAKIREGLAKGETHKELAEEFDVHYSTIGSIASGRTWVDRHENVGHGSVQKMIQEARTEAHKNGYNEGYEIGFKEGVRWQANAVKRERLS
ncbi:MAG: HNH endonuclease [Nitrososphaerales archaeon]